ncbi:PilN domain-containing protein [Nitrospira defluvii]|nr:PilN domain-containing protein [Nitrospira defluvii]
MIKINLLSPEKSKKGKRKIRLESQMIWTGFALLGLVVIWTVGLSFLNSDIAHLQSQEAGLSTELAALKVQVKEVDDFEENKIRVKAKIQIIEQLRKNQSIPVYLLDEISKRLPARVWLVSLSEQSGTVDLSGRATTNSEIVDFINNLKNASAFQDVQIIESRQNKENNITVYSFRLKWSIFS